MRIIMITGVSRGLGAALCSQLNRKDTRLIGFSRNVGSFQGEFHSCDLTKPQLVASIMDDAFKKLPDRNPSSLVFINNAGQLGPIAFIDRLEIADIQENLTTNLLATTIALSHFIKYTKQFDIPKAFINISSGAALPDRAKPGWSLYCAAKAGQDQLIRAVAAEQEHVSHAARVVNINPGVMETRMQEMIRATPKESFPEVERFIEMKEKGQVESPEEVAARIAKALDDLPSLRNGHTYTLSDL